MTPAPLFGILIVDRDPFTFADFWGLFQAWLQDAGGFAFVGLLVYFLYVLLAHRGGGPDGGNGGGGGPDAGGPAGDPRRTASESDRLRMPVTGFMLGMAVLAIFAYAGYFFLVLTGKGADRVNVPVYAADPGQFVKYVPPKFSWDLQPLALTAGGLFAVLGIGQPFAASLLKVRARRVGALARVGFKEAVRSRLFWVFLIFLIPFLLPARWFFPIKAEDELRSTVAITSLSMNILLLFPAALLAAFSIPNDIKNQNLYTIVTKPVERFEIVLGRVAGYTFLMTLALAGMTALSWAFIRTTGVDEKAKAETLKARVPARGEMRFASRKGDNVEGTNVGREFDYRRYIAGDPSSSQRAVWSFPRVPGRLAADRDHVPVEFTFDIYRMTKGEENRGVDLTVRVVSWQCPQVPPTEPRDGTWKWADPAREQAYLAEAKELVGRLPEFAGRADQAASILALAKPGSPEWGVANQLADKYGFFEVTGKEIFDYHPDSVAAPVGVFSNALKGDPKAEPGAPAPPRVQVYVKCNTRGQMLGMAAGDLYLLEGERSFDENYFKAAVGLWCRVALVIGLAVACSTYLAGVISFLAAGFLFLAGYASDHLSDMASGKSYVGGPLRAVNQLLKAEQPTAQVDPANPLARAAEGGDVAFSWLVRRFVNMVPDVYAYSWTTYVSEGFNVPLESLVMNLVVLVGYLLPWLVLGYYLIRSREVAA